MRYANEKLTAELSYYNKEDKALVAVDCIIFGFYKEKLKLLLIKRDFEPEKGKWSLIGGFLKSKENLDQAAIRVLESLTGLQDIYMEQIYTYSKVGRDSAQRTISVSYYALIDIESHRAESEKKSLSIKWFDIKDIPKLIFDHNEMANKAVARLRRRALSKPIGFELLPKKFTMKQLQTLYEGILDKKLDKRNFINKIIAMDVLKKLEEKDMKVSRKGAYLYSFDEEKYAKKVKEDGFSFKI